MKGLKATEKMAEDWERGPLKVKSNTKPNLRKKVETTSLIKFKNNPNTIICFKTRLNNKYNIIVSIIGCFSGPVSVRPTAPIVTTQGKYPYFVTKFKGVANPFRDNPRGQS